MKNNFCLWNVIRLQSSHLHRNMCFSLFFFFFCWMFLVSTRVQCASMKPNICFHVRLFTSLIYWWSMYFMVCVVYPIYAMLASLYVWRKKQRVSRSKSIHISCIMSIRLQYTCYLSKKTCSNAIHLNEITTTTTTKINRKKWMHSMKTQHSRTRDCIELKFQVKWW